MTVNVVKAAKPEKAKMVEDILISNARMGRLGGQVSWCFFGAVFNEF